MCNLHEMNCKMSTMNKRFEDHDRNNKSVAFESHKEVEKLSKILNEERVKKLEVFTHVDDLMSQVYIFQFNKILRLLILTYTYLARF